MTGLRWDDEPDELIERAGLGDQDAWQRLIDPYRGRLRRMIAMRMDARLSARVDPSDVIQEALVDAAGHLGSYVADRPLPFYLWLRRLAWERLVDARRRHVVAQRRSVRREEPRPGVGDGDGSAAMLADRLMASGTSPSRGAIREEMRARVLKALGTLSERDREILVQHYLEALSTSEIAAVLGLSVVAVRARHTRALARLRRVFERDRGWEGND